MLHGGIFTNTGLLEGLYSTCKVQCMHSVLVTEGVSLQHYQEVWFNGRFIHSFYGYQSKR